MQRPHFGITKILASLMLLGLMLSLSTFANAQYTLTVLTADQTGKAPNTDPNLINPWGISFSSTGDFWVSDNNSGLSTLYDSNGVPQSLVVTIPSASGTGLGTPTGTVFNATTGFVVKSGTKSGAALFLFDSEDGVISGWNPIVAPTAAVVAVNNSSEGAVYKGMEIADNGTGSHLYLANFFAGTIEVYDSTFKPVSLGGTFTDARLPAGFAPHNIRNINGQMYVAYAKQNATKTDAVPGAGLGIVDIFDLSGNFVKRFAIKGSLNAPWGLTAATASFGQFSNDILVGNLGDGKITAFDPTSGANLGQLSNSRGPLAISGLWALQFGNGGSGGLTNVLYVTAGPTAYKHGRFASIAAQ